MPSARLRRPHRRGRLLRRVRAFACGADGDAHAGAGTGDPGLGRSDPRPAPPASPPRPRGRPVPAARLRGPHRRGRLLRRVRAFALGADGDARPRAQPVRHPLRCRRHPPLRPPLPPPPLLHLHFVLGLRSARPPPRHPAAPPPRRPTPSAPDRRTGPASGRTSGSAFAVGSRGELGAGLVEVPSIPRRDPLSVVMTDPEVPERKRHCARCGEPVGRSRGSRPGRTEGLCPWCGARLLLHPQAPAGRL